MLTVPRHMLVRPGEPQHGINIAVTPEDHKEKKRKIDAKYRLGCKTRKEELRIKLQNLREENAELKREKESCSKEDNSMAQKLQSKELEIGHLKREIGDSKKVISRPNKFVGDSVTKTLFVQQLMLSAFMRISCPGSVYLSLVYHFCGLTTLVSSLLLSCAIMSTPYALAGYGKYLSVDS
ncbi:hypothetical protein OIU79_008921 [Salix purpurea]|uniref:BZIP domain-containing protein n=1 Tax=Salix purpurea TaxID=77065 RepID=A0A9Q0TJG6_SALPP|nr:hypothetical protein OIU79_008921 [Salix purpurea]